MTWPAKKLGDPGVCTIIMGQSPPSSSYNTNGNGLPFYQGKKDFGKIYPTPSVWCNAPAKIAYANDILISVRAPVGPVNFCREKTAIGRGLAALRANGNNLDYRFLFLFLKSIEDKWNVPSGAVFSSITKTDLENLPIPIPPLEVQKKIVEKIEGLFAKIDEAARLNAESLSTSAALLPSALHHIVSSAEKEGWEEKILGDIAEINPSKKEISELRPDTKVSFVPMSAVSETSQNIERQEVKRLEQVKKGYTYFKESDVLFAKITPCMENGKIVIAGGLKNGIGFGSTEFHVLRAKEMTSPSWLFYFLWNPEFRKEAEKNMTGTAGQQRVPADFLKKSKIPLPPIPEQKKIVAHLNALSEKSRTLQEYQKQTAEDLSRLKQSILEQAFGGMS